MIDKKETLIKEIVECEWAFFQQVQNEGGRADCQDDPWTFEVMRKSQFLTWPEPLLNSYLEDLKKAEEEGRNLLTEKYAYMMKYTAPLEFSRLEPLLPAVTEEKEQLAASIAEIQLAFRVSYEDACPRLSGRGRPLYSSQDKGGMVSFETYLKGELLTYSISTLEQYLALCREYKEQGKNLIMEVMEHTVRFYGYQSLQDAEEKSSPQNEHER